jgi:HEAT repeat protein
MTDTSQRLAAGELPETEPVPAVRGEVHEVLGGFSRALRTHLLYEGQSPALDRFVETLRERMRSLWGHTRFLQVQVSEREILWHGEPVYVGEERENLAFLLYRDGVREMSFMPGFEEADLDAFLGILARIHRLRTDEEDLLTLLWEHDWEHFRYRYVESLAEGVHLPEGRPQSTLPAPQPPRDEPPPPTVSTEDFREALYFLDEGELRRVEGEVRREMERDLWTDVVNALLDRLEDSDAARQVRIVGTVADILPNLLGAARVDRAAYLMENMVTIATSPQGPTAPVLREIRALFDQLATPETIGELARTIEDAGEAIAPSDVAALLAYFPPEALRPLLKAAEGVERPEARATLLASALRLAGPNPEGLRSLVADADPAVAAGAARLVGRLRTAEAAPELARLMRRPEASTRLAAVEALQELRSPSAAGHIEKALEDEDREVRIAAARALAALRWTAARPRLEALIDGKRLREADLTERIAFFEAYGTLAGPEAVPLLDRLLNGKNWLGRRESGDLRACAALGLGRIRHADAERALGGAAADPDPVVRNAVGRALRMVRQ